MKKLFLISAVLLAVVVSGCSSSGGGSGDVTAPTVSSVFPANGAINVAVSTTISVTFDEAMDKTATQAAFDKCGVTGTTFGWTSGDTVMTFTPASALANGTLYSCTVGTGATDVAANPLAVAKTWSFTTVASADTTPPTILSTDPANGDDNTPPGSAPISVNFSEAMNQSSAEGAFHIFGGITGITGTFSWVGNTMIFHPTAPGLVEETLYNCSVDTSARDVAGNYLATLHSWTFTTGTAPIVTSTTPADGDTGIGVGSSIVINFSMAMARTATLAAFNKCGLIGSDLDWSVSDSRLTFIPDPGQLVANTTYHCSVGAGAVDVTYGIPLIPKTWSFTTTDTIAPTVVSVSPAEGTLTVSNDITTHVVITFSEPMATVTLLSNVPGGTTLTGVWSAGNTVLTISRTSIWVADSTYNWVLTSASTDVAGNALNPVGETDHDGNTTTTYDWRWKTAGSSGIGSWAVGPSRTYTP